MLVETTFQNFNLEANLALYVLSSMDDKFEIKYIYDFNRYVKLFKQNKKLTPCNFASTGDNCDTRI